MADGVQRRIALLCGHCPTRRVLCYLVRAAHVRADHAVAVMPNVGSQRRQHRPSVAGGPDWWRVAVGDSMRRRCKRGHAWAFTQQELTAAYLVAVEAGRREIVAGFDLG